MKTIARTLDILAVLLVTLIAFLVVLSHGELPRAGVALLAIGFTVGIVIMGVAYSPIKRATKRVGMV
ncbi:hypothetical protein [Burkholderia vietnamiensis]|uniref:hypothetical protein n=1 Tax=Burkholderia vietnamiensis TaxID=60552 RepID=UPI001CF5855A|nr:hypothetical protein [Burkholderia vietnamiensis]MCA8448980.1 hypothetical protein [Burkholderia vietnamiensis]